MTNALIILSSSLMPLTHHSIFLSNSSSATSATPVRCYGRACVGAWAPGTRCHKSLPDCQSALCWHMPHYAHGHQSRQDVAVWPSSALWCHSGPHHHRDKYLAAVDRADNSTD
eukprot:4052698-Amphidinium_carterae.2